MAAIEAGAVTTLMILGTNPVLTAPVDLRFAESLSRVPVRIHLGLYDDETAQLCHWHVPEAHFLESWSDVRAFDGTASIIQPLIAPLYDGRSAHGSSSLSDAPRRCALRSCVRNGGALGCGRLRATLAACRA